jgi:2',3'-cyclic-nucleotide 2'-phosphodiesterase (5'-nucleotidase family)
MSKILKITVISAALLAAFLVLPMMALQASSTAPSPVAPVPAAEPLAPGAVVSITILHTNDFHGQLEPTGSPLGSSNPGIARVGYIISDVIRPAVGAANVVLLDAGDEMQGSLLSNLKKGEPTIDLFNLVGYQAATFGNHEFDWGQQTLISRTQQAQFPYVSANIVVSDSSSCDTAGWTSPSFAKPWITMTVGAPGNQAVLGIVGVTTQETPYITIASATQGLCFKDPAQAIVHHYDDIKAAGADTIVVLSHLGFDDGGYGYGFTVYGDKTLAKRLVEAGKPVPLIIGGHSHTDYLKGNSPTNPAVISGTTVVQAYYNGRKIGRADLAINTTADTAVVSWQPITVTASISEDIAIKNRLATWTNDPAYQAQINQVIGWSYVDMVRNYDGDNFIGTLVNDSILNDLNTDGDLTNDVDMVFNNPGGLRADITSTVHPYTMTYGMLFNVLPFGNATLVGDMTGAQIQDLLNQSATLFKGALQVGGVRYKFYRYSDALPGPQPYAWGAYDIVIRNRNTGIYEPLVMTRTYRIATNEFLAPAGQDGFVQFKYVTNYSYWGDMLNQVNHWISMTHSTPATAYKGPNGNGLLDGRITRNGTNTYNGTSTEVVPVTVLHHNDAHGRLLPSGSAPGYTNLATLIKQERQHNPTRTILLNAGDTIQGDAMAAYYKAAFTGLAPDGTTLPVTLTVNPILKTMNALTYTAMTLGNHEFNYGSAIFVGTLGQATFPLLQANVYDTPWPYNIYLPVVLKGGTSGAGSSAGRGAVSGIYGLNRVNVRPHITVSLPGPAGNIDVAILGIGNHRVPNYELPSNIPGLLFTNPITETQARAPALKAVNDVVIALTHIGFAADPYSVEVDDNVDVNLAAQSTGVDAIIGGHSHTNPSTGFGPYKFLPTFVGAPDNTPVIINQAYRYNSYLGEVVLGMLPDGSGGYDVVSRAGRYIQNTTSVAEDPEMKAIVQPYDAFFQTYKNRVLGQTNVLIDATNAYITETNGANLQVDASLWKLNQVFGAGAVQAHLSGAMTNAKIPTAASPTYPYTMTVNDMFTLMPYENSLVVFTLNGPQLKTILERAYRNYWYYKYSPNWGGYSHYTTCMLDVSAGSIITYDEDPITYTASISYVVGMSINGTPVNFNDAATYYTVSTVNYVAAGSCNFNNGGVTLWPLDQIVHDTQYYVRDVMIDYIPTLPQPIAPPVYEGRIRVLP